MVWLMLLLVIVSGAVLCAQSAINGRLGAEVGVLESAWLTFALGTLISFFAGLFFWSHPTPTPCSACRVGKWAGRFFGVIYMLVIVFAMPRIGTAAATVAVISGQLLMSLLIDHFGWLGNAVITLGPKRECAWCCWRWPCS